MDKYHRYSSDKNVSTALAPDPIVSTFLFLLHGLAKLPSLPKFQILSTDNVRRPREALPITPPHPWLGSYAKPEWGWASFRNWNHSCLPDSVSRCAGGCEEPSGLSEVSQCPWGTRYIHRRVLWRSWTCIDCEELLCHLTKRTGTFGNAVYISLLIRRIYIPD